VPAVNVAVLIVTVDEPTIFNVSTFPDVTYKCMYVPYTLYQCAIERAVPVVDKRTLMQKVNGSVCKLDENELGEI
jgi:hypothetical protein